MRHIQTSLSILTLLLILSCSGGKDQQQEQQKEPTLPAQEMKEVTAQFSSFELSDMLYITFFDQQGTQWDFGQCRLPECEFGVEAEVSNMENQGWRSNSDLIGKWFDLTYMDEEIEFPDGTTGSISVIVGFSLNDELNVEKSIFEQDLDRQQLQPRALTYTVTKVDSMTTGRSHTGNTNAEGTRQAISEYVGGGYYRTVVTTASTLLELDDLSSGGSEMSWSGDGELVAINGLDLYSGRGSIGLILIHVPTGQYLELGLQSLIAGVDFGGRKSLEIQNMSWTSDNQCLFELSVNYEGESGHPGIDDNRKAQLGSNFGKDDPIRVGFFQVSLASGYAESITSRHTNSSGITIESYAINDRSGGQSLIPRLNDRSELESIPLTKINKTILDRFYISQYEVNPAGFDFVKIDFTSELNDSKLYVQIVGEYLGNSISEVEYDMLFDLETGEQIISEPIEFHTFFRAETYTYLLTTYWLEGVDKAFEEAVLCAGAEPYCSKFDVASYSIESDQLTFSLTSDCFPSAAASCAPSFSVTQSLDSLASYFNAFGKSALIDDNILSMNGLEKYEYLINNEQLILENSWELEIVTNDL